MKPRTFILIAFFLSLITITLIAFMAHSGESCQAYCVEEVEEEIQEEVQPGLMIWENLPTPFNASARLSF